MPTSTPATWPPRRLLVPLDFSDPSRQALDYATALAGSVGATITVLHVGATIPPIYSPLPEVTGAQAQIWTDMLATRQAMVTKELEAVVQPLRAGGLTIDLLWAEGEAANAIAEAARDLGADLVVMGSHGRTGLKRALLGSVAERTARMCASPVLIVR